VDCPLDCFGVRKNKKEKMNKEGGEQEMLVIIMYKDTIQEVREYKGDKEFEGFFTRETLNLDEDYCIVQLDKEKREADRKEKVAIEGTNWLKPKVYKPQKEEE
jgi:hypothetical protein